MDVLRDAGVESAGVEMFMEAVCAVISEEGWWACVGAVPVEAEGFASRSSPCRCSCEGDVSEVGWRGVCVRGSVVRGEAEVEAEAEVDLVVLSVVKVVVGEVLVVVVLGW